MMIFARLRLALHLADERSRIPAMCLASACLAAVASVVVPPSRAAPPPPSGALPTPLELDRLAAQSAHRWELSEHGEMLVRIVPRQLRPSELPEPESEGARLTGLYCVQCHYLPSPAMHDSASWEKVVRRMLPRMRGEGNMGRLMARMMLGPVAYDGNPATRRDPDTGRVPQARGDEGSRSEIARNGHRRSEPRPLSAPSPDEAVQIIAYLQRHAMHRLTDNRSPALAHDVSSEEGAMFVAACGQCHVLPDPAAHSADEWPAVVQRMEKHMRLTNRVVDAAPDPREPQLQPAGITRFLQRHAKGAHP